MTTDAPQNPSTNAPASRLGRASAIIGAGLIAGIIAASAGGIASAQTAAEAGDLVDSNAFTVTFLQTDDEPDDDAESRSESTSGTVIDRFEQCLEDSATELDALDEQGALDGAAIEDAFERCALILEELDEVFGDDGHDFGDDDHDFGLDFDFGGDPHLDFDFEDGVFNFDFGEGFAFGIDLGLSPEDEAVFEKYETCLDDAGVTFDGWLDDLEDLDELDIDNIEAAFEDCEPLLDELSDDVHAFFADCPEDDDDDDDAGDEDDE